MMLLHYSLYTLVGRLNEELRLQKKRLQTLALARSRSDLTDVLSTWLHGGWGPGGFNLPHLHALGVSILSTSIFFFYTFKGSMFCRANIGFAGRPREEEEKKKGHRGREVLSSTPPAGFVLCRRGEGPILLSNQPIRDLFTFLCRLINVTF